MRKQIYSICFVLLMLAAVWARGIILLQQQTPEDLSGALAVSENAVANAADTGLGKKTVLRVWYTQDSMTEYLKKKASAYSAEHEDILVVPMLAQQAEYLESVYQASIREDADSFMPDLYLTTNDTLEKAYLSGIAMPIDDPENRVCEEDFPDAALCSVTYQGNKVAYPLSYETAIFLYNKTYLEQMAAAHNQAMADVAEAEASQDQTQALLDAGLNPDDVAPAEEETTEQVEEVSEEDLIPKNFEDILNLANDYDAPEGMEAILKWDVTDVFYNYFFAGNYMQLGGENGDDKTLVDLNNPEAVACLEVYQALRQFFSIEAKDSDYETILKEFAEGKLLFTIATTDALEKLDEAKAAGEEVCDFGVGFLPDLNENLTSRGLSVTNVVVVNGFSHKQKEANAFAAYLTCDADSDLYRDTGHLAASRRVEYDDDRTGFCMAAYEKSIGLPKLMEASNFWMQLEITMTRIWEGEDITEAMAALQDQMQSQIQ